MGNWTEVIRFVMEKKSLNQIQMAESIGTTSQSVWCWLHGKSTPRKYYRDLLSKLYVECGGKQPPVVKDITRTHRSTTVDRSTPGPNQVTGGVLDELAKTNRLLVQVLGKMNQIDEVLMRIGAAERDIDRLERDLRAAESRIKYNEAADISKYSEAVAEAVVDDMTKKGLRVV